MSHIPGDFGKKRKCPCCNNPWNSDSLPIVAGGSYDYICQPCLSDSKGYTGIDPENIDPNVSPSDNFYLWSNGGWKAKNPIPAEYSSWNTFIALRDQNLDRLKTILDELGCRGASEHSGDTAKLGYFYQAFMDEDAIEKLGVSPIKEAIDICFTALSDPTSAIANLHNRFGIRALFSIYSSPDKKNSEHSLCSVSQSGLGLPDRDYYFDADKAEKRDKYREYIETLFYLLGSTGHIAPYHDRDACKAAAAAVLAFETSLASAHLTRTAARDPELTYNKMSISELCVLAEPSLTWSRYLVGSKDVPGLDWPRYFTLAGKGPDALGDVNVATVAATKRVSELLANVGGLAAALPHYLCFHVLNSCAPHLPAAFADAHFQFHEKELKGTAEIRPRWKRALEALEDALGDALGQLYVSKYFSGDAKPRALRVVELVRDALRVRLGEVGWMSSDTRSHALQKMEKFKVKIGYPDKWIDYSAYDVREKSAHLVNVFRGRQFQFELDLARMNSPTDRGRWFMTPQTVNAYYHPSLNEIVFPAAILQAPFFDPRADEAVNFGSLGAVVGHEMTHGFDDQGRKYDSQGNMRDWWASGDGAEYERRAAVMIKQAEQFEVYGIKLKGKLTCGENIADLGGLKLAYRALKQYISSLPQPVPLVNGFTPEQRFFLAWAQAWRENVKKERAIQLVTLDPHGPNELRCNQPLSNMQEFLEAFDIKEGDAMYKPVEERVDIW